MKSAMEVMRWVLPMRTIFSMTNHHRATTRVGPRKIGTKPNPDEAARPTLP
jgi:hypothetical protein